MDPAIFKATLGTVYICEFTRHKIVQVIDVQEIESVVALLPFKPPLLSEPATSLGTCFIVEDLNFNATEFQDVNLNDILDDVGR